MSRIGRIWRWLWRTPDAPVRYETHSCPDCGAPVEIPSSSSMSERSRGMWLPPTHHELLAACATHGSAPQNQRTIEVHGTPPDAG